MMETIKDYISALKYHVDNNNQELAYEMAEIIEKYLEDNE